MKFKEKRHRRKKREWEMALIIKAILRYLRDNGYNEKERFRSLEFGCGDGFQIPYLEKISEVTAIDIYISEAIKNRQMKNFVECSITNTPFEDGYFDLIFSNHVVEHIEDLQSAFGEMKRIGKNNCLYAFSVPTNVWLLLSLPAQYYHKVCKLFVAQSRLKGIDHNQSQYIKNIKRMEMLQHATITMRLFNRICPRGHGVIYDFATCYQKFKVEAWKGLFEQNRFLVKKIFPLLLYAPSELPIVPTIRALKRFNICSSVLFLMQKML